jgi:hypothetical protein
VGGSLRLDVHSEDLRPCQRRGPATRPGRARQDSQDRVALVRNCETAGPRQRPRASLIAENRTVTCGFGGALGGTRTPNLLIRRSRQVVQDCLLRSVRWADIPQLSTRNRCCPAAWQQSRRVGLDPRPSASQAAHIPSWRGSRERSALSLVAASCHWSPLLLSASICEREGIGARRLAASCRRWVMSRTACVSCVSVNPCVAG